MKTLNFELSKRLNDLGLLDNVETEYGIEYDNENQNNDITYYLPFNKNIICKTLILEEAIEFLKNIDNKNRFFITTNSFKYFIFYGKYIDIDKILIGNIEFNGETLLEAIEKMIEYLLDNNLLTKNKDVQ